MSSLGTFLSPNITKDLETELLFMKTQRLLQLLKPSFSPFQKSTRITKKSPQATDPHILAKRNPPHWTFNFH